MPQEEGWIYHVTPCLQLIPITMRTKFRLLNPDLMGRQHLSPVSCAHSPSLCSSYTGLTSYPLSWPGPGLWVCALAVLCACRRTLWTRPLQGWALLFFRSHFICQSLPSGSFHKPLFLVCQRADRMKTTTTENQSNWSHGSQPCLTQWNYEACHVGPSMMDGSWWRVLTKHGPLEKGMVNHSSNLPWEPREQYEKTKR